MQTITPEQLQELLESNTKITDEQKAVLKKALGVTVKPKIVCTDTISCMSYTTDSFAREIFRPTIIIK